MANLNEKKYQNIILYLSFALGGKVDGKKKLAKLLYFVDFDFFEKYGESLTGDVYKSLPMGPFPVCMEKILEAMQEADKISINKQNNGNGYNPTEVYSAKQEPEENVFEANEIKILDRVILKYGHLNGKQLEDLTHSEAPFVGTEPGKEIVYELSFYRGTDFGENA